jgi:hypothetical protein
MTREDKQMNTIHLLWAMVSQQVPEEAYSVILPFASPRRILLILNLIFAQRLSNQ